MRSTALASLAILSALLLAGHPRRARACAPAPAPGHTVEVASEEALVVWDAARRIEHFVRRADFRTDATDFGFLVPTPTQPELAEASDEVFSSIASIEMPEVRHEKRYDVSFCVSLEMTLGAAARGSAVEIAPALEPSVVVLASARVAGLDAVVLDARDATALDTWLREHGYASRPALMRWVAPYITRGWKITAFKLAKVSREDPALGSRSVRMSFRTEQPFFPYSEPDDQPQSTRRLFRVHVVSSERVSGRLGNAAWTGTTTFARPIPDPAALLRGVVPAASVPTRAWITTMEERSSTRGRSDLDFVPSRASSEIAPPPIIVYDRVWVPIPLELIVPVFITTLLLVRRARRMRAKR